MSQRFCRIDPDAVAGTAGIQPFAAGTTIRFGFCIRTNADADCAFVCSGDPGLNPDGLDHMPTMPPPVEYPGGILPLAREGQTNDDDMDFADPVRW
jgi:hypothetical protein